MEEDEGSWPRPADSVFLSAVARLSLEGMPVLYCAQMSLFVVQAARGCQAEHKAAKQQLKECGIAVNSAKRDIDEATAALEAKKAEAAPSSADVLDSEEHRLLQTLKAAKLKFRRYGFSLCCCCCCLSLCETAWVLRV